MRASTEGPQPRVVTRVVDTAKRQEMGLSEYVIAVGKSVLIGREGDISLGVEPSDTGISRHALVVTAVTDGWELCATNGNGAVLHAWGQAATWLDPHRPTVHQWPRLAVRLVGSRSDLQHWVLLEADHSAFEASRGAKTSTNTETPRAPLPLTHAQLQALTTVFAQHLAWPPVSGPVPLTLQAAARRLGISDAAVYQRLEAAQGRAYQLGSHRQHGVTEPEYLYVLVRHGYLSGPGSKATEQVVGDDN